MGWTAASPELGACWAELYPDMHMLLPAGPPQTSVVWLHYAALDFRGGTPDPDLTARALVRIYDRIAHTFTPAERGLSVHPRIFADVRGEPRIGFVMPDLVQSCHETALVEVVLDELGDIPELSGFVAASARAATFRELRATIDPFDRAPDNGWEDLERALGWLVAGDPTQALRIIDRIGSDTHYRQEAIALRREALRRGARPDPPPKPGDPQEAARAADAAYREARRARSWFRSAPRTEPVVRTWEEARDAAAAREAARDARGALEIYETVRRGPPELDLALARCRLALRDFGHALEDATRVVAHDPSMLEAHAILVAAWLAKRAPDHALDAVQRWIAISDDAQSRVAHAKCLFALGRWDEASRSIEDACTRGVTVEAMVLRRLITCARDRVHRAVGPSVPALALERSELDRLDPDNAEELREIVALAQHGSDLRVKLVR